MLTNGQRRRHLRRLEKLRRRVWGVLCVYSAPHRREAARERVEGLELRNRVLTAMIDSTRARLPGVRQ